MGAACMPPDQQNIPSVGRLDAPQTQKEYVEQNAQAGLVNKVLEGCHDELSSSDQSVHASIVSLTGQQAENTGSQRVDRGPQREDLVQCVEKENSESGSNHHVHRTSNAEHRLPLAERMPPNQQNIPYVGCLGAPQIQKEHVEKNAKAGLVDKVLESCPDELLSSDQSPHAPIMSVNGQQAEYLGSQPAERGPQREELVQCVEKENSECGSNHYVHKTSNAKHRLPFADRMTPNQQNIPSVGCLGAPQIQKEHVEQNAKAGLVDKVLEGILKAKTERDAVNTGCIKKKIESVRANSNRSVTSELQQTMMENIQNCGRFRPKILTKIVKSRNV